MNYGQATKVLAANAACQLRNGCNCCPVFQELVDAGRPEGYCNEFTSYERVKEAVETIHRAGILNSISVLM